MNEHTNLCDDYSPIHTSSYLLWPEGHPIYLTAHWASIRSEAGSYSPLLSSFWHWCPFWFYMGGNWGPERNRAYLRLYGHFTVIHPDTQWYFKAVLKWAGSPWSTSLIHCSSHRSGRERQCFQLEQSRPGQLQWHQSQEINNSSAESAGHPSLLLSMGKLCLSHSIGEALPVRILCPSVRRILYIILSIWAQWLAQGMGTWPKLDQLNLSLRFNMWTLGDRSLELLN